MAAGILALVVRWGICLTVPQVRFSAQHVATPLHLYFGLDPIFYLHHANLDRVWWSWQKQNISARLKDISGPINILDFDNVLGGNVTLEFPLSLGVNAPNVTIEDVMNIQGDTMCYGYHDLY